MVVRRGQNNMGLLLLGTQVMNYGLKNIPPATLALIGGQTAIFLEMFPDIFPSPNSVCVSSYLVYYLKDWPRMILSTFYHAHDMHLYFNMASLLYKGSMLEKLFGTPYFIYLITVFTALTSGMYVGIGVLLGNVFNDHSYLTACAVGFSGVLFAMKVLTTHYSPPGVQLVGGVIPVPSKYVFWAELVLIQLVTPNASFVGHLAGILVGCLYVYGPLKFLMDAFFKPRSPRGTDIDGGEGADTAIFRTSPPPVNQNMFQRPRPAAPPPEFRRQQATPSAPPPSYGFRSSYGRPPPPQPHEYSRYTGDLDEDEQYRIALEESMRDNRAYSSRNNNLLYPDLEDLRNRRSQFYQ